MAVSPGPTLIAVLDYGIGNLRSAQKALQHVGADARLTADPGLVRDAAAVVLPGVGAFGACLDALREARLEAVVHEAVLSGRPFLGICVGQQMLFEGSDEDGATTLGVLPIDGVAAGFAVHTEPAYRNLRPSRRLLAQRCAAVAQAPPRTPMLSR